MEAWHRYGGSRRHGTAMVAQGGMAPLWWLKEA